MWKTITKPPKTFAHRILSGNNFRSILYIYFKSHLYLLKWHCTFWKVQKMVVEWVENGLYETTENIYRNSKPLFENKSEWHIDNKYTLGKELERRKIYHFFVYAKGKAVNPFITLPSFHPSVKSRQHQSVTNITHSLLFLFNPSYPFELLFFISQFLQYYIKIWWTGSVKWKFWVS